MPDARIGIIDYDAGNLTSVANAFDHLGFEAALVRSPAELDGFDRLVLPGVGAFAAGMTHLRDAGFVAPLADAVMTGGRPLLCICLGMHLLATIGEEHGSHEGLGWIPGSVRRLEETGPDIRIPHFGWNEIKVVTPHPLLDGIGDGADFYFAHSYFFAPDSDDAIVGTTEHGQIFSTVIARDNIFAVQFHPEKSHQIGLRLLRNFAELPC